jgi:hypothetical protein
MAGTCFVISPIGDEGSEVRRAADNIFRQLIEPVTRNHDLEAIRADHIRTPGQVSTQVLRLLRDADIVIADLAGLNANVFYELAFRHTLLKPAILLSPKEQRIPFDIADSRAIIYNPSDWSSLEAALEQLNEQLRSALHGPPERIQNPIAAFFAIEQVAAIDSDPMAQLLVRVNAFLERMDQRLEGLEDLTGASDWRTNAEYIDGQDDAFEALTKATREARFSVRSSRFFPASIMRRPDYLQAIEERVRGSLNRPPVQEYRRIIALNNIEKKADVMQHIINFTERPFTLFLTSHENTFELVVIDDTDVFIHFAKEELVIASTLHLRGRRIAERFTEVFDQLATRDQLAVFDCLEIRPNNVSEKIREVDSLFSQVFPEEKDHANRDGIVALSGSGSKGSVDGDGTV